MNKKGIEITFNWIFVIIAGSILLFFLIYFGWKQIGLFNKLGINEVVTSINNEIDALTLGLSSFKVVELPKDVILRFNCGEVIFKEARKDTLNLIYANGLFKDKFNLWSKEWSFPFKIDNFYYISNIDKRLFIIGNENFFFNIPDKFKKFNKIENELKENDIIIDFTNSNLYNRYKNNKVLVVKDNFVTFYPENKKEGFFGEEMLYGALFSNYDDFICLKEKSIEKLELISELYKKKIDFLKLNSKCSFQYSEMSKTLDLFKIEPLRYKDNLIEQNNLIKRESCADVF